MVNEVELYSNLLNCLKYHEPPVRGQVNKQVNEVRFDSLVAVHSICPHLIASRSVGFDCNVYECIATLNGSNQILENRLTMIF